MNCGWDIALVCDFAQVCEMCHKQHYVIMPKNFCICLPSALEENVLPNIITDEVLDQMFLTYSTIVQSAIQHIIIEDFFCHLELMFL